MSYNWTLASWVMVQLSFLWATFQIWSSKPVYHYSYSDAGSGPEISQGRSAVRQRSRSEFFRSHIIWARSLHRLITIFLTQRKKQCDTKNCYMLCYIYLKDFLIYIDPDFNTPVTQPLNNFILSAVTEFKFLQNLTTKLCLFHFMLPAFLLLYIRYIWVYTVLLWFCSLYYNSLFFLS